MEEEEDAGPGTMRCDNCGYHVNHLHRVIHVAEPLGVCSFCFEANPDAYEIILGVEYASGAPEAREFDWEGSPEEPT